MALTRDVTRVDVPALRETAAQTQKAVSNFRATLDKMEKAMNASESFWEGDAAELYRSVFRREMTSMRQAFEAFAAHPNELENYADLYENVERKAEDIAASAQQAVWADV